MHFLSFMWKGLLMSISQLIPGVSGSSIAIILGIYDQLLTAISRFTRDFRKYGTILLGVGLGAVIGIVLFAKAILWLIEQYPVPVGIFFIGIILGGTPLMYQKAKEGAIRLTNWLYFLIGFVIVVLMGLELDTSQPALTELSFITFIYLFIGGIIFAIALILPGISGSFMLLVMGLYQTMIVAAADMNFYILLPIGLGTIIGTFLTARAIEWLLHKYPQPSYLLILGFMLGSIFEIFPGWPKGLEMSLISIALFLIGFIFIWKTSKDS